MTDPRDFNRPMHTERRMQMELESWAWITGAALILVIVGMVLFAGTRTSSIDLNPPATTGAAPKPTPPTPRD